MGTPVLQYLWRRDNGVNRKLRWDPVGYDAMHSVVLELFERYMVIACRAVENTVQLIHCSLAPHTP